MAGPRRTRETEQQLPIFLGGIAGKRRAHAVVYLEESSLFVNLEEGQTVVMGRSSEADVVVNHSTVSRKHIALTWANETLTVQDFGSTNGTFINGRQIAGEVTLHGGEELHIGDVLIVLGLTSPPSMGQRLLGEIAFQIRLSQELLRATRLDRPLVLLHLPNQGDDKRTKRALELLASALPSHAIIGAVGENNEIVVSDSKLDTVQAALDSIEEAKPRVGIAEFPRHGQDLTALQQHALAAVEARGAAAEPAPAPTDAGGPVAVDPVTTRLFSLVSKVASAEATTLIVGETGVGKDVVARELHRKSRRKDGPYIHVNCGAVPSTIFAREMFGHEQGAFTGAQERSIGLFEAAQNGTLFLDEVAEIPLSEQARLLRALEHRTVTRVGGVTEIPIDIRVISATNRDLDDMVVQGLFREDLLYRLNVITLFVPALRDRPHDIEPLSQRFFQEITTSFGRSELTLSKEAVDVLTRHSWPGNVRELRNVVERAVLMADSSSVTDEEVLNILYGKSLAPIDFDKELDLKALTEEVERHAILRALAACGQNQSLAAGKLGVSRRTLIYKMKRYGIPGRGWKSGS